MSDPRWVEAHQELADLHELKSATYGTPTDPLANFVEAGRLVGDEPERVVLIRIVEKASRALHMIAAGDAQHVQEYPDLASLALCAEALRRRRGETRHADHPQKTERRRNTDRG